MLRVENDFVPKLVDIIPSKLKRNNLGLDILSFLYVAREGKGLGTGGLGTGGLGMGGLCQNFTNTH
jgi:hypothetical protein